MIEFQCSCGEPLRAQEKHAGRKCQCVKCGNSLRVPMADVVADDSVDSLALIPSPPRSYPEKSHSTAAEATVPIIAYGWCRTLQGLLAGTGVILFLVAAVTVLFAFKDIGDNGPVRFPLWISIVVGCISSGFIELACAELLGGLVAYLQKHDCRP